MILLYGQCCLYLGAGISHFLKPQFFESIVPDWLPFPKTVNILAGIAEILLAVGLFLPATRQLSAYLLVAFLIAVFPANIKQMKQRNIPLWTAWLMRLPLQLLLIYLALRVALTGL